MPAKLNSVDVSTVEDFINEHEAEIALSYLIGTEFAQQVTIDTNVHNQKAYEKLVVKTGLKPYTGTHDPEANKVVYSDRLIQVKVLQDDYMFDAETFRKKFMGEGVNLSAGEIPRMQLTLDEIVRKNISIVNNEIIYGASVARPNTDAAYLRQANGFGKQITDLIADGTSGIIVRPTGALTGGTGWGANGTTYGNIIEKVDIMDESTPADIANVPRLAYMSYAVYNRYINEYKRRWALGNLFTEMNGVKGVYTDTSKGLLKLEPCRWMGTTERIFITTKKNLVFGTDITSPGFSLFSMLKGIYQLDLGCKLVYGMLVVDPEAMVVNEL